MNQHWLITYEKLLIHFGTDILKIVAVLVFWTPHIFANGPHFVALTQLRATKQGPKHLKFFFGMHSAQGFFGCMPRKILQENSRPFQQVASLLSYPG